MSQVKITKTHHYKLKRCQRRGKPGTMFVIPWVEDNVQNFYCALKVSNDEDIRNSFRLFRDETSAKEHALLHGVEGGAIFTYEDHIASAGWNRKAVSMKKGSATNVYY